MRWLTAFTLSREYACNAHHFTCCALACVHALLLTVLLLLLPSSAQSPQAEEHSCLWLQAEHIPAVGGRK
jgi:hypothetical protein